MRANDGVTVQLHLRLNWHYIDGGDKLASWLNPMKEPLVNKSWCGFCTGKKIICSLRNRHSVLQSSNPYPSPYTGWNTLFPEVMWNHVLQWWTASFSVILLRYILLFPGDWRPIAIEQEALEPPESVVTRLSAAGNKPPFLVRPVGKLDNIPRTLFRWRSGNVLLIVSLCGRWSWVVTFTPRPL